MIEFLFTFFLNVFAIHLLPQTSALTAFYYVIEPDVLNF